MKTTTNSSKAKKDMKLAVFCAALPLLLKNEIDLGEYSEGAGYKRAVAAAHWIATYAVSYTGCFERDSADHIL